MKMSGKKAVIKGVENVDAYGSSILEQMDLKPYISKKMPKGVMKSIMKATSFGIKMLSASKRAYNNPAEYLEHLLAENIILEKSLYKEFAGNQSFIDFSTKAMKMLNKWLNLISVPATYATMMAKSRIKKMFRNEEQSVTDQLSYLERAFPHNVTIEMGDLLYELSRFQEIKDIDTTDVFLKKLKDKQFLSGFSEKWQLFMKKYGFRCPGELDIATPRYYEKPEDIYTLLKTMSSNDNPELSPKAIFSDGIKKREETVQYFIKRLKSKKQLKLFNQCYEVLKILAAYREIHKYYMIMAFDLIRRKALETADDFVKTSRLDSRQDIFNLKIEEVSSALQDNKIDLRLLIKKNQSFYNQFRTLRTLPSLIDSRGFIPTLKIDKVHENELLGTPVSPGIVLGPVKILSRPDEKPVLPGDILVAQATDPGWTTLFLNAGE